MAVERNPQQRMPGQFGPGATSLSDPDLSAASFSTQGVENRAGAARAGAVGILGAGLGQAASGAIELGSDFHKGLQLADVESEQEALIEQFMASRNNPNIAREAAVDASTLSSASEGLWARLGEGATVSDIDNIEKGFQDTMAKYKDAVEQGVMSVSDFQTRSLAITREAVNRNPALYQDILSHANKVMGLSGISSFLEAEEAAGKNAQKMMQERITANRSYLISNNIMPKYLSDGSYDLAFGERMAQRHAGEEYYADAMARTENIQTKQQRLEAIEFMKVGGMQGMNGTINRVTNDAIALLQNPETKGDVMPVIRSMLQQVKMGIQNKAAPIIGEPAVDKAIAYAEKSLDAIEENLTKLSTNQDKVDFLKNMTQMAKDDDYLKLVQITSPEKVGMLTKVVSALGVGDLLHKDSDLFKELTSTLHNLLQGVENHNGTNLSAQIRGKNAVGEAVKTLAGGAANGDQKAANSLDTLINTTYADIQRGKLADPTEKFNFYDSYIKSLGTPGVGSVGEVSAAKAGESLQDYMNMTLGTMNKTLAEMAERGTEVRMSILPDGRLGIQSNNPKDTELLIKRYGIRINNAMRAFSSITNSTPQASHQQFYESREELKGLVSPESFGQRPDGSEKGTGFLGVLKRPDGGVSTEISVGVNIDGKEVDIPLLVPTLSKKEVDSLLSLREGQEPEDAIVDKAVKHARERIKAGQSPFKESETKRDNNNPPNETNPLNLTIPGRTGEFQRYGNVEEGIRAASTQLDRYFQGKTTGKPLQTLGEIGGLWNNEKEKGSMSKKDYVSILAKHTGFKPNEPLDLNNPDVKADLLYAISLAEGKPIRPSQIIKALALGT